MYGIEKLKEVATDLAKFGMRIEQTTSEDSPGGKRFTFGEAINLGIFAVPKVMDHVPDAEQIKQEFLDLDSDETAELVDHIATELDLASDAVEAIVEAGFDLLASLNNLRLAIKEAKVDE